MTASAPLDPAVLHSAVEILRRGGLVAYPTDTLYGLAALPGDAQAIERLFEAKRRPTERSVPILIASPADLDRVASDVPAVARRLMQSFWPGALTIVLRTAQGFHSTAVGETVALRVPDHAAPRELVRLLGGPITGTSANVSGGPEPLTADDVRSQLGDAVKLIIDGGACRGGLPSTVVDCATEPPRIVREGAIGREELERAARRRFS